MPIVVVVILLVYVFSSPWALHIGGKFTPLGQWDGVAALTATNGGRYVLFAHLQGGVVGTRRPACGLVGGCDTLHGSAKLCTQSGTTYSLKLTGAVHSWWSTDGADTTIDLSGDSLPGGRVLAFKGRWAGPALPLADIDNSFTQVFARRGAIRLTTSRAHAGSARGTLRNGSSQTFDSACRTLAARRH